MKANNYNSDQINLDQLIKKLKKSDRLIAKVSRFTYVLYWVFLPVIILGFVVNLLEKDFVKVAGMLFEISSFFIMLWVFGKMYKDYKEVDYSIPVIEMLKKSADRYRLIPNGKLTLVFLLGLLMMSIGIVQSPLPFNITAIQFLSYFWGFVVGMLILGIVLWYFQHKPLRDKALQLVGDIEDELI